MPLFFTHIANDRGVTVDDTGHDHSDKEAAIKAARLAAGSILSEELSETVDNVSLRIYLEDEARAHIATISVSGTLNC